MKVYFCINKPCIRAGFARYAHEDVVMPYFQGKVLVPSKLARSEIPMVEDVQWVFAENPQ
jgi:hypothetical protein